MAAKPATTNMFALKKIIPVSQPCLAASGVIAARPPCLNEPVDVSEAITAGKIPALIRLRDGTVPPQIALAQSTAQLDWSKNELRVYAKEATKTQGLVFLPGDLAAHELKLTKSADNFKLATGPVNGKVTWQISIVRIHCV